MKFKLRDSAADGLARRAAQRFPYSDLLLDQINRGDDRLETAFGRHLHWGFWPEPHAASGDALDYAAAAERLTQELCGAAGIGDGQAVLDVGCGFGGTIASLDEHFQRMQLKGLNIDPTQIERARGQVTAHEGNQIEFVKGEASQLPFPDLTFDVVLAVEAIFHFPDRAQFFREANRVLKPGGRLALSDFVPVDWIQPALWLNIVARHYGDCDLRCSLSGYRRIARETGFRTILERDVTTNTLPTFAFLKSTQSAMGDSGRRALRETQLLHAMSRLGLLRYTILAFEKNR